MPRESEPLPHPLNLGVFSFREARLSGVGRSRLRHQDVAHPHHGLYAPTGDDELHGRCFDALPLLGEHRWYSHLTAARLWEMPLPRSWQPDEPLHVLALPGVEPIRRPGIVGWESADQLGGVLLGGIPVIVPAAVWAQLSVPGSLGRDAETRHRFALEPDWLVAVGDYLLTGPRRPEGRKPLCTLAELHEAARGHRGKRGARALTRALELVRPGPQSSRESLLRLALMYQGLPEPSIHVPVRTRVGIRHVDLGYPDERLLIEYHGDHHRTDPRQWREDLTRRQLFEDAGYRVIEAAFDVFDDDCAALALRIRRALTR